MTWKYAKSSRRLTMKFDAGCRSGMGRAGLCFKRAGFSAGVLVFMVTSGVGRAQAAGSAKDLVMAMVAHEDSEALRRGHYMYVSKEKSDRTNGHVWTERVAETSAGKIRMLVAEDGQPLTGDRLAAEKARMADIAAHPDVFRKQEQARKDDELRARQMLDLLPKAFLFENPRQDGGFLRIDFRPNPDYSPQSMEERVLHGMTGSMLVDERAQRLHRLDGRLPQDVSIGFGLVATIHAGSNFSTTRDPVPGDEWKTSVIDTDINGRVIFFKSIGKKQHAEHSDFKKLPQDVTVAQAVEMVEK